MMDAAREIRRNILKISHASGHGHIPTCFSVIECLMAVYETIKHDPAQPDWSERDLFVLSKGHAALGHYGVLAQLGYFSIDDVYSFGASESFFGCHADRLKVPGIEVSTGSLGHGIAVSVGMALAEKTRDSSRRVISLIGDGESNEGSVWEAFMVAADQKLDNLTVIFDANQSQSKCLQIHNPGERLRAFGFEVAELDGHDIEALCAALTSPAKTEIPKAIIANTRKGYGCATMVDNMHEWHRNSPDAKTLELFLGELDA